MAINNYTPPGVRISELTTPSVTPGLAPAGVVCIVGEAAQGYASVNAQRTLSSTSSGTNVTLSEVPATATSITVASVTYVNASGVTTSIPSTGSALKYVLTTTSGSSPQIKLVSGSSTDATYNVTIRLTYIPADYYDVKVVRDYTEAEDRYGLPFDSANQTVKTPLTLGIKYAFENGARDVYALPISTANATTASAWQTALNKLHSVAGLSIVVPVISSKTNQADIFQAVQNFQKTANETYENQIFAVLGQDGSTDDFATGIADLRTTASTLRGSSTGAEYAKQAALVSPAVITRQVNANETYKLGGQYLAAAIAGMLAGRLPSRSITRQAVVGVSSIDYRSRPDLDDDSGSGLLVVYQNNGLVQVRHGKTLDLSPTYESEIAVVRAKGRMIASIRDTLENQIIGQIVADDLAPATVSAAVVGILQLLQTAGEIVSFQDVQAKIVSSDPTQMDVRFSYLPSFPLNYINIGFSINLATNTAILNTATTA